MEAMRSVSTKPVARRVLVGLFGLMMTVLSRGAVALTAPTPVQISPTGTICHDFPDVVVTTAGTNAYATWTGYDYSRDTDDLYRATLVGASWTIVTTTGITGDLYCPRLGYAGGGNGTRVIWSQQVSGNWDLYTRRLTLTTDYARLTTDPGSDTNVASASDPGRGRFFVVWQGFRGGKWAIFLMKFDNGTWGPEEQVSQSTANEWFPKAAVDSTGRVWIAWDSYRNGNYDVYLRSYMPDPTPSVPGTFGSEIQVTANSKYEANVSVACDADNRVWMTWETGGENWGKDFGRLTNEGRLIQYEGNRFLPGRRIAVGVYDGANVKTPAIPIDTVYPGTGGYQTNFDQTFDPIMAIDSNDCAWVFHARRLTFNNNGSGGTGWRYAMTRYNDTGTTSVWDAAVVIPTSLARIERKMAVVPYDATRMLAVWHVDGRWKGTGSVSNDLRHGAPDGNKIYAALIDVPVSANVAPALVDPPVDGPTTATHPTESADVAALRAYTATIGDKTYHIVRGDLHRHTDTSWDGNNDSSIDDLARYGYDAAALDFIMPSDHHTQLLGNDLYADWNYYPWHRTQKFDDMYFSQGTLIPFQGYERSVSYPNGHRNVIYPIRSSRGDWVVPTGTLDPLGTDEGVLWSLLKPRGGISIPHTSGNDMGTSWDYGTSPTVETVMEIYQGDRYSYENYTTYPVHWPNIDLRASPSQPNEAIHPDGFYFSMLAHRLPNGDFKRKLGMFSSSDHLSTHLSYGCVYVEEGQETRQGILDAIKARHCYGAMDNIIMDVRCGTAMMGDEVVFTNKNPTFDVFIQTAKPLNEVAVIRDNTVVFSQNPSATSNTTQFQSSWTDYDCAEGYHYYYVRARQNDGMIETDGSQIDGTMAWSSPIWLQRVIVPASWVRNWFRY